MANKRQREFTLTFNLDAKRSVELSKFEPEKTVQKFMLALKKTMDREDMRNIKACACVVDAEGDEIGQWSINNTPTHYELRSALRVLRSKFITSSGPLIKHEALKVIATLEFLIETADEN